MQCLVEKLLKNVALNASNGQWRPTVQRTNPGSGVKASRSVFDNTLMQLIIT